MAQDELNLQDQEDDEDTLKGKHLIFSLGDEMYGMEIRYITEIIGIQPITEVPEMPQYVRGITNLRGKIIPVMDARLRFKKAERDYDDRTCIIVIDTHKTSIGLIVDSVAEVLTLQEHEIVVPPEIVRGGHRYIKGIGNSGGKVRLLLDCERLLTDDEADSLGTMV
jgi:purine-binding chemotaxis protein CheW